MIQHALALPLPSTSAEGRRARDRGIRKTESANGPWLQDAMAALRRFCVDRTEVRVEEFRHWWLANGGREPTSPNAYGALGNAMNRCTWLRFARYEKAKSVKTHAHPVAIYSVRWAA